MKFNSKLNASGITLAMSLSCVAFAASAADLPESPDPIKLSINEWTGQHITTKVAGKILERMGYNVEFVTAGYLPQFTALSDGSLHAALEIWLSNIGETWPKARDSGNVVEIGPLGIEAKEGWVYPVHMAELCPGLPDWKAMLEPQCVQALATADTLPDGRILDYPSDWGQHSIRIINGLELDFQPVSAGSEGALVAELKASTLRKSPIVAMFWSPHWLFNEIDLNWVELPAYEPACLEDPAWGPVTDKTGDCGMPTTAIIKVAWSGMEDKWPAAYRFLENFEMNTNTQIPMMAAIDVRGEDLDTVVNDWVENNSDVWQPWVDAAKQD